MLTVVKKNIALIGHYFKLNLSASMEYRTSFLIQIFGMILNNASFAFFWWLLFEKVNMISGYGFHDVMLLWAFSSTSYGLSVVFFGNANELVTIIIHGELDSYLLQPKDPLINVIASKTKISGWGDVFYGLILFFIISGLNFFHWGLFILFVITGTIIFTAVFVTANSLAFYFGNISSIARLALEFMITFSIYPEGIFKGFVKFMIFTIIPAGFITMVPVRLLNHFNILWLLITIGISVLWIFISYTTFYNGLKKYESGNLMVQKM